MPSTTSGSSGACPSFFRALCRTARDGSTGGYLWAGHGLAGHIIRLSPNHVEDDVWADRVEALEASVVARDDAAVLSWLDVNLPRCMALVPRPRRSAFLRGVYRYVIEEENGLVA